MFFHSVWNKPSAFQPLQFRQKSRLFPKTRRRFYRRWRTTTPSPSVPRCVRDEWWWFSHFLAFRLAPQSRPPPPTDPVLRHVTQERDNNIGASFRQAGFSWSVQSKNRKNGRADALWLGRSGNHDNRRAGFRWGVSDKMYFRFFPPTQNANTMATEWWRANINQALLTYIYLLFCYCWCWWWGSFSHLLADPRLGYCKMLYRKVNLKENQVDWPLAWREKTGKFPLKMDWLLY